MPTNMYSPPRRVLTTLFVDLGADSRAARALLEMEKIQYSSARPSRTEASQNKLPFIVSSIGDFSGLADIVDYVLDMPVNLKVLKR